jgi:hypothetical protein
MLENTIKKEHRRFMDNHPKIGMAVEAMRQEAGQAVRDPRLYQGLAMDALGYANYFAYLLGPQAGLFAEAVLDPVFGGLQVKAIEDMYKNDLNTLERRVLQTVGFLEEALPGTDIIPTMTMTNLYVHGKRALQRYRELKRTYAPAGAPADHPAVVPAGAQYAPGLQPA